MTYTTKSCTTTKTGIVLRLTATPSWFEKWVLLQTPRLLVYERDDEMRLWFDIATEAQATDEFSDILDNLLVRAVAKERREGQQ